MKFVGTNEGSSGQRMQAVLQEGALAAAGRPRTALEEVCRRVGGGGLLGEEGIAIWGWAVCSRGQSVLFQCGTQSWRVVRWGAPGGGGG